jgi:acetylornithine deacetylase/succinyl-diaminopimelate desuccinylase-like protein
MPSRAASKVSGCYDRRLIESLMWKLNLSRFAEKGTLRMTFEIAGPGGHGAYVHRAEGAIRTAVRLIEKLITLENLLGEGMDPDLLKYLERADVRRVADRIMGDGAASKMLVRIPMEKTFPTIRLPREVSSSVLNALRMFNAC